MNKHPLARDEMTTEQFNARIQIGYTQAQSGQSAPADEVFARLLREIEHGKAV